VTSAHGKPATDPVVVVATEETARRWSEAIAEAGLPVLPAPWSSVVPTKPPEAILTALRRGDFDAVLLTSAHAARFVPPSAGMGLEAVVVGAHTAALAAGIAGFHVRVVGEEGAGGLAKRLVESGPPKRLLWLRGEEAHTEGADVLATAGWIVIPLIVYRTVPREEMAVEVRGHRHALAWVVGSPAAAGALRIALGADLFPPLDGGPPVIVPGETTAAAVRVHGRPAPVVALSPDAAAIAAACRAVIHVRAG
jgi:uroporphyrinogen-III synthase